MKSLFVFALFEFLYNRSLESLCVVLPVFSTMWILPLVGYFGVVGGFAFLTLAIGTYDSVQINVQTAISAHKRLLLVYAGQHN